MIAAILMIAAYTLMGMGLVLAIDDAKGIAKHVIPSAPIILATSVALAFVAGLYVH